jgi:uncharacterized protein (TIGR02246 family)
MRSVVFLLMVGLVGSAFLLVGCQPAEQQEADAPAAEPAVPAMSDEDTIRKVGDDFITAWNASDADAIAGFFAEDGDYLSPDGGYYKGREAIAGSYRTSLEGMYKGTTIVITTTSLRFLETDVAISDGTYEITGLKDAEGQDLPNIKGMFTNVMTKMGDEWFITCSRPMVPIEMPGTT